jgi:chromate transport protein ChrA
MFYGVVSMIIVEKYPTDMGFMFGIANVTAGFVLFFLTNYIASNTEFLDQIMVITFWNTLMLKFNLQLVLGIFCAVCIVYPLYELREIRREEKRKQEGRQHNDNIVLE